MSTTTKTLPATEAAQILSALDAAMAYTQTGGAGQNHALWDQLLTARASVIGYLLSGVNITVQVETRVAP